jgi:hypothetical protein
MYRGICNICISIFGTPDDISDYEEKLLEKCFDKTYDAPFNLINTQYEPPKI